MTLILLVLAVIDGRILQKVLMRKTILGRE